MSDDDRLTDDELEAMREREQATTGDEWGVWRGDIEAGEDVWVTGDYVEGADAEFIRHVRQDYRALLDEVERLRRTIEEAADGIERMRGETAVSNFLRDALEGNE